MEILNCLSGRKWYPSNHLEVAAGPKTVAPPVPKDGPPRLPPPFALPPLSPPPSFSLFLLLSFPFSSSPPPAPHLHVSG